MSDAMKTLPECIFRSLLQFHICPVPHSRCIFLTSSLQQCYRKMVMLYGKKLANVTMLWLAARFLVYLFLCISSNIQSTCDHNISRDFIKFSNSVETQVKFLNEQSIPKYQNHGCFLHKRFDLILNTYLMTQSFFKWCIYQLWNSSNWMDNR